MQLAVQGSRVHSRAMVDVHYKRERSQWGHQEICEVQQTMICQRDQQSASEPQQWTTTSVRYVMGLPPWLEQPPTPFLGSWTDDQPPVSVQERPVSQQSQATTTSAQPTQSVVKSGCCNWDCCNSNSVNPKGEDPNAENKRTDQNSHCNTLLNVLCCCFCSCSKKD